MCVGFFNGTSGSDGRSSLVDDKNRGQKPRIESDAIISIRDALDIDLRLTVLALAAIIIIII